MLPTFRRRLLELLYNGRPEAAADVATAATRIKAERRTDRARIQLVPDAAAATALAPSYNSAELGRLRVSRTRDRVTFEFGTFASAMGTRRNDDGTISFVTLDAAMSFLPFVVGTQAGRRTLTVRDDQHAYVFVED